MKALVTGSEGFVGRHLVEHLSRNRWSVQAIDILNGHDVATFVSENDTQYDLVIHAAAAGANRAAIDTKRGNFSYNVMLDSAMFEWAIRTQQKHFVYLSSSAVYPAEYQTATSDVLLSEYMLNVEFDDVIRQPFDVYGLTKIAGEHQAVQARRAGVLTTIVRPFSGYGEDQSEEFPFRAFVERVKRLEQPFKIWGSASQIRDWIHIDDICRAITQLVEYRIAGPVNLCTGRGTTMRELAELMLAVGSTGPRDIIVDEYAPMGVQFRVGDPSNLNAICMPKITIEEGVSRAFR